MLYKILLAIITVVCAATLFTMYVSSEKPRCPDFENRRQAHAALSTNPQLDRDHDGIACETLPK